MVLMVGCAEVSVGCPQRVVIWAIVVSLAEFSETKGVRSMSVPTATGSRLAILIMMSPD